MDLSEEHVVLCLMILCCFYGDVTKYQDYDIIKRVADEENVRILFPKGKDFVDLGGIVSLWR